MPYNGPGIYQHYKGGLYEVIGLALREDSIVKDVYAGGLPFASGGITEVIYKPIDDVILDDRPETFWSRELEDFNEMVYPPDRPESMFVPPPNATIENTSKTGPVPRFRMLTLQQVLVSRNKRLLDWARAQLGAEE